MKKSHFHVFNVWKKNFPTFLHLHSTESVITLCMRSDSDVVKCQDQNFKARTNANASTLNAKVPRSRPRPGTRAILAECISWHARVLIYQLSQDRSHKYVIMAALLVAIIIYWAPFFLFFKPLSSAVRRGGRTGGGGSSGVYASNTPRWTMGGKLTGNARAENNQFSAPHSRGYDYFNK